MVAFFCDEVMLLFDNDVFFDNDDVMLEGWIAFETQSGTWNAE